MKATHQASVRKLERSKSVMTETEYLKMNRQRHKSIPPALDLKQLCFSRGVHQDKSYKNVKHLLLS